MPVEEERKLRRQARKRGLTGERADAYVHSTMNKIKKARSAKRRRRG